MSHDPEQAEGKLGFLGPVMRLFRREEAPPPRAAAPAQTASIHAGLEAAIHELNQRIDERRRAAATQVAAQPGAQRATEEERAAASQRRMESAHRTIREDIEAMHAKLETGLASADLERIAASLRELAAGASEGKDSHELLPRARWAVGERLRREAGELAVARLVALLKRREMSWPDPTHYRPGALPEEIERSRSRRLRDVRAAFLAQDFEPAADAVLGVVRAWRSDYPNRSTPLWEETVLEAVAAGIRGHLIAAFVEVVRRDREQILSGTETSIGKQLAALQALLAGGVDSIEQANQAVASCLRVIDEVLPETVWEHVRAQLPQARGEW